MKQTCALREAPDCSKRPDIQIPSGHYACRACLSFREELNVITSMLRRKVDHMEIGKTVAELRAARRPFIRYESDT